MSAVENIAADNYQPLIQLFDELFYHSENTRLIKGDGEPVYIPAGSVDYHQVVFAHGFYASALHEIAHWCVAGKERRLLMDYGYWYEPDGRTATQQQEFEQVEVKPQAIEWIFTVACGRNFRVSVDNLSGETTDAMPFKKAVLAQVKQYLAMNTLPPRAKLFADALAGYYQHSDYMNVQHYSLQDTT